MPRLSRRTLAVLFGMIVCLIVLAGVTWTAYTVYLRRSDTPFVRQVAGWLPAARVGSRMIPYRDFLSSRDALRVYLASDAAKDVGLSGPVTRVVEKNALDRLMREAAGSELAAEQGITLSDDEIRAAFTELLEQTSSTVPNVAEYLEETFQWDEEEFRTRVIRPSLLEERLGATFPAASATSDVIEPFPGFIELEKYFAERLARSDVKTYLRF